MKRTLNTTLLTSLLLMSACSEVKKDKDIPSTLTSDITATGQLGPDHSLEVLVGLAPAHMIMSDIEANRFQLRQNGDVWEFQYPIDWAADPFDDLNWRLELNKLVMIDPYLTAFEKDGDKAAFQKAVDVVLEWQDFHQTKAQTTSVSWLDMVAGQRASRLAYIVSEAELNSGLISDAHLSSLISLADFHVKRMKGPGFMPDDNHGIFDALGVAALCATLDALSACSEAEAKAQRRMREIFFLQFSEDGGHREHSPLYHYFALNAFSKAFESGLFDGDAEMMARKEKALALQPWFLDGTGKTPAIGDSERVVAYVGPGLTCEQDVATCTKAAFLPKSGYGIIKTVSDHSDKRGSLVMSCNFHSYIHKHLDELSFEWAEKGQHILVDSGKYSYDNVPARHYMLSRAAHNTVLVDGERFSMKKNTFPGACLREMSSSEGSVVIQGDYDVPGVNVRHTRQLSYVPGRSLTVLDTLEGSGIGSPEQVWHFAPEFEIDLGDDIKASNGRLVLDIQPPKTCEANVVKGREGSNFQGWVATGYRERVEAPVLIISCPKGTTSIETRFDLNNATSILENVPLTTF